MLLLTGNELAREEVWHLMEHAGMRVVGGATSAKPALARTRALGADVTVLNSRIADGKGVEVGRQVRESSGLGCVALVIHPHEAAGPGAAGCGLVLMEVAGQRLVDAVRRAAARMRPEPGPEGPARGQPGGSGWQLRVWPAAGLARGVSPAPGAGGGHG